jgi:hypothetical protein
LSIITGDELYDFYAQLGQALYALQNVEGTLHRILCVKVEFATKRPAQSEADEILARYRDKTLGGLITAAKKSACLNDETITALESLNAHRKFVVHRLLETAEEKLRADSGFRPELVQRLENISDQSFELNTVLVNEFISGVDPSLMSNPRFQAELQSGLRRRGFD